MERYHGLSDEKLIQMYKDGSEFAIDCIFEKYKNLVRKKAKAMYIVGGDNDDLIQEGMIGLYKAIRDYDVSKEASFMTFASMCINRQMCTAVTISNRKKHMPLNGYISLDVPITSENDDGSTHLLDVIHTDTEHNPEKMFIDRESADTIEKSLGKVLSKFEQKVLSFQMEGFDYVQIAQKLDKTPKSIDNALQRIRNKLNHVIY